MIYQRVLLYSRLTQKIRQFTTISANNCDVPVRVRFAPSPTGQLHLGFSLN